MNHSQQVLSAVALLTWSACSSSGTTAPPPPPPPPPIQIDRLGMSLLDTAVLIGDRLPIRSSLRAYNGTTELEGYMVDSMYRIGRISLTFPSFVRDSSGTAIVIAEGEGRIVARAGVVEYVLNIGVLYDLRTAANWKMNYSCRSDANGDSTATTVVGPITYPGTQQNFPRTTRWAEMRGMQLDSTWRQLDGHLTIRGPFSAVELLQQKAFTVVVGSPTAYHATAFLVDGQIPRTYRTSGPADAVCVIQWSGTILTLTER